MKEAGPIRLLQPKKYGGLEVHPREFAETVMNVAALDRARLGHRHRRRAPVAAGLRRPEGAGGGLGPGHDTWVASPYAPTGIAVPVDGGYIFNGRWQFSSGTDHCDWIFLGAMVGDADGSMAMPPTDAAHDPAAQGLRDRRGLLGRGGPAGHRLQGHHRQGRVRARRTGSWTATT